MGASKNVLITATAANTKYSEVVYAANAIEVTPSDSPAAGDVPTAQADLTLKMAPGVGSGDVNGPEISSDGTVVLFDGISGSLIKDSGLELTGVNTGDQDLSGLALKANVLELDNTSAFTPDADYEPATKKYVDDNTIATVAWGDVTGSIANQTDLQSALDGKADDGDLTGLALKANVLELDNTSAFTPDADYEPATKKYVDDNAGTLPLTTKGDVAGFSTIAARIPVGTDTQVLTADSTQAAGIKWATPASGGMTDPMTTRGDIIIKDASNATARLPIGTSGQVLGSDGTDVAWTTTPGGAIPALTLEPTGFTVPEDVIVSYDQTTTTKVTLTGTVNAYWRGTKIAALVTGWTSPALTDTYAVPAANTTYFLYYNGTDFIWSDTAWPFDAVQISTVRYGPSAVFSFCLRECHGLMPWQSHQEMHDLLGTYKDSGGAFSGYTLASTTAAERRPDIAEVTIKDEDLLTVLDALSSSTYSIFANGGTQSSPTESYGLASDDIVALSTNQPYYNLLTGGNWTQALMTANKYMSIWAVAIPAADDAVSKAKRILWVQGQDEGYIATQRALIPSDLDLGALQLASNEFVFIAQIIIQYISGNWKIKEINQLSGSKAQYVSSPPSTFDPNAIHGNVADEINAIAASDITLDDIVLYEKASTGEKGSSTFGAPFIEQVVVITGANETAFPTFTGIKGQEGYYNNKYYRCIATDTWVRWAVETA